MILRSSLLASSVLELLSLSTLANDIFGCGNAILGGSGTLLLLLLLKTIGLGPWSTLNCFLRFGRRCVVYLLVSDCCFGPEIDAAV